MVKKFAYKSIPFYNHKVFSFQGDDPLNDQGGCKIIYMDRYLGERIYEDGNPFVSPYVISMTEKQKNMGENLDQIKKWERLTFGDRSEEEYFKDGKYILPESN